MVTRGVQDSEHNHIITIDAKEDSIGKSIQQNPAKIFVLERESLGELFQLNKRFRNRQQEFITQAGTRSIVPLPCFAQVFARAAS